jgi:hypothetical protein
MVGKSGWLEKRGYWEEGVAGEESRCLGGEDCWGGE